MYALYLIAFFYIIFLLRLGRHRFMSCICKNMLGKKNHRGFELSVSKIIVCIALYCFGQSLMGMLLSQAEFYAVEIQAEIEHTSESRSKSNLISSLAENVGLCGLSSSSSFSAIFILPGQSYLFLMRNSKRVASLSLIQKPIRANSFENF